MELTELQALLRTAKINSRVMNEGSGLCTSTYSPYYFVLYVEDDDVANALKLISQTRHNEPTSVTFCRKCGSENISKHGFIMQYTKMKYKYRVLRMIVSLLLLIVGFLVGSDILTILCFIYFVYSIVLMVDLNPYKKTLYQYYTFYYCDDCKQTFNISASDNICYRKDASRPFINKR